MTGYTISLIKRLVTICLQPPVQFWHWRKSRARLRLAQLHVDELPRSVKKDIGLID